MTLLPIVERELRVASRERSTYWSRLATATLAIAIGGWIMLALRQNPKELGYVLFVTLSVLTFIFCLFAGLTTTADCLSEEKREGTLGLLFLTDLKGYDIVLGKLAATSLKAFYGMLAVFPVLAISLLLGGVAPGEFWRVMLVAINNLVFSLAAGLFASAISRDERKAVLTAFLCLVIFAGGFPALGAYIHFRISGSAEPSPAFLYPSPVFSCVSAFDASFTRQPKHFWGSVITIQALAWLFLVSACLRVPRSWQDQAASAGRDRWRDRWRRWLQGNAETRNAYRGRLLAINPFFWVAARDRLKSVYVWITLGVLGLIWTWGHFKWKKEWHDDAVYIWTALITHTLLKFWLASESSRRFALDRRSGALELVLSSPLSVRDILAGQLLALRKQFGWPAMAVLAADLIFLLIGNENEVEWVLTWLAGMVMFLADLYTLSWVGMWSGLKSRSINRASSGAIFSILALPWIVFGMVASACAIIIEFVKLFSANFVTFKLVLLVWFAIGISIDLLLGIWARQKLLSQFRRVAIERFGQRPRVWFGRAGKRGLPPMISP